MSQAEGLAKLEAAGLLGASREAAGVPIELFDRDGQALGEPPIVRPADGEELARALTILGDHEMAALVRGGGSRLGIGNPPRPIDVVLETRSLNGVSDFERDDGVVQVRAGTPLSELREVVAAEGWALRLDPPGVGATVGGTLAAAAVGPRVLGYGNPRDSVLGLDVVLASGEQTSCGGRVVKNVTGYDMAKLYVGSFGTLGVIASAWLRLASIPELEQILGVSSANFENMFAIAFEASRRSTARAVALLSPVAARRAELAGATADDWVMVVELAGDELANRSDASWLAERVQACGSSKSEKSDSSGGNDKLDFVELPPDCVERVRDLQASVLEDQGLRARFGALPTSLPALVDALTGECPGLVVYPGVGLVYAFSPGGDEAVEGALAACTRASKSHAASVVFEALPNAAKTNCEVFEVPGPELVLMRELKQRFDPAGVLNPGRFAGGI